ncbi:hypothetical protein RFY10_08665, partial [Acinetobacter baumannii]|nr:hypothetical protein [Acinetobacter baumannii]
ESLGPQQDHPEGRGEQKVNERAKAIFENFAHLVEKLRNATDSCYIMKGKYSNFYIVLDG